MCEHVRASRIIMRPRAVYSLSGIRSNDFPCCIKSNNYWTQVQRDPVSARVSRRVTEVPVTEM